MRLKYKVLYSFYFIIYIIGFGFSNFLFMNGYHTLDIGHNIIQLNEKYETTFADYPNPDTIMDGIYLYDAGFKQMKAAFFLAACSALGIGFSLTVLWRGK